MIQEQKCIVMDIDGTLCPTKNSEESYTELEPHSDMVRRLKEYKKKGFYIIFYTARQMRTHDGNIGKINATTAKITMEWLDRHKIPYDEIHFGKPWQGRGGFYVDDKTIRPSEFLTLDYKQILHLIMDK